MQKITHKLLKFYFTYYFCQLVGYVDLNFLTKNDKSSERVSNLMFWSRLKKGIEKLEKVLGSIRGSFII